VAFAGVPQRGRRSPVVLIVIAAMAVAAFALATKPASTPVRSTASAAPIQSAAGPDTSSGPAVVVEAAPQGSVIPPALNPKATPYPPLAGVPSRSATVPIARVGHIAFALPAGWQQGSDAMYLRPGTPVPLSIGAWRIRHVNIYPCRWSAGAYADLSDPNRAEGVARALSSWWGQDPGMPPFSNSGIAPLASKPVPTTLLGYPAWYVEVLIPTDIDFSQCDGGQLVLWDSSDANARYSLGPSEVNRIWVVDVDRGPIVIDAGLSLRASGSQKAELQAIVNSALIEP
jgi:hypothetical protein